MNCIQKSIYFFFFLLLTTTTYAQFEAIDKHALNTPNHLRYDIEKLTKHLTKTANSDLEKVRAFYVWLADNIAYDVKEYEKIISGRFGNTIYSEDFDEYEENQMQLALIKKIAVCHGYSLVFQKMCDLANIQNRLVTGNSKNRYNDEVRRIGDHSWNTAFVDGKWRLFDPTWGAGVISNRRFNKRFNEFYFDTPPKKMIIDHFPADPMWQLLPRPLEFSDFEEKEQFINEKLSIDSPILFAFNDSIQKLFSYPEKIRNLISAENAYRYNPQNYEDLGFAWNNHAVQISNKVISMQAGGEDIDKIISLNEEAILAQSKSIEYVNDDVLREGLGIFYLNQAKFYQDKGNNSAENNQYPTAIDCYNSSTKYIQLSKPLLANKENMILEAQGTSYLNLGYIYSNMAINSNNKKVDYEKAFSYLEQAKSTLKAANTNLARQNLRIVEQNLTALKKNRRILGF